MKGERVQWARTLGLEGLLAKHLPMGTFHDQLSGIRDITDEELSFVMDRFIAEVPALVSAGLKNLRSKVSPAARAGSEVQEFINTKFSLGGAFVGKFATLDDFYKGPEALIGTPNPKIMQGIETEHCLRSNCKTKFKTGNYNLTTWPALEWEFVVKPRVEEGRYPHTPKDKSKWPPGCGWRGECGRDAIALEAFLEQKEVQLMVKRASLMAEEVVALRLYTGPMFVLYNAVLRGFPEWDVRCLLDKDGKPNRYETTIFAVASGITKISKVTQLPPGRRLWRGLGGMILPKQFWEPYFECQITFAISVSQSAADAVLAKLRARATAVSHAGGAVYDAKAEYLRLTDADSECGESSEELAEIAKMGLRVVQEATYDGEAVRMSVALRLSKDDFQGRYEETFLAAVRARCGGEGAVRVEEVADKPNDFRGGGE